MDKAALAAERKLRKENETKAKLLLGSGAAMSKEEQKRRKRQQRLRAIAAKKDTRAMRQEMAEKAARRKALEQEDQEQFDASRRPPPKTIVGEIGDWYENVVKHQVDYATHKANEARAKKLKQQEEMRKQTKPSSGPARYYFQFPSPLLLEKLGAIMSTHTIPGATPESVAWINTSNTFSSAARNDDVNAVVRLLAGEGSAKTTGELPLTPGQRAGVDINRPDGDGVSPLMWACWNGSSEITRLLIDAKADLFAASKTGAFPLYVAAQEGHMDCMRALLEAKADVNQRRNDYATSLHGATRNVSYDAAKLLLNAKADVEERSESYDTTLMLAVYSGDLQLVQLIIDHKADLEASNAQGQFPLSIAVHRGDVSWVDMLVTSNANVDRDCSKDGSSGLHISVVRNAIEVVFELLELKANPVRKSPCTLYR